MTKRFFNIVFVLFVIFGLTSNVNGQYTPRGKEYNYLDAETFYNVGNYYDALHYTKF